MAKEEQYLSAEDEAYLRQREEDIRAMSSGMMNNPYNSASTMFANQQKQNLVEWQLDFRPELEDIEHLIRCDIIVSDPNKGERWEMNPNKNEVFLNAVGVNDVLREIRMFLNKNTVLSNYDEKQIELRLKQIGHELRQLIYNNQEKYGIDNDYKMNNYSIMVMTVLAMIESAYRRAINGEERRDLNSARIVNQTDPVQPPNYNFYPPSQQKKVKVWNPLTWGR